MKKKLILIVGIAIICCITVSFMFITNRNKEIAHNNLSSEMARGSELVSQNYCDNDDIEEFTSLYMTKEEISSLSTEESKDKNKSITAVLNELQKNQLANMQQAIKRELDELEKLTQLSYTPDEEKETMKKKKKEVSELSQSNSYAKLLNTIKDTQSFRTDKEETILKPLVTKEVQDKVSELSKTKEHKYCTKDKKDEANELISQAKSSIENDASYTDLVSHNIKIDALKTQIENGFEEEKARQEEEAEREKKRKEAEKIEKEKNDPKSYTNTPSYESLARNPEKYYDEDLSSYDIDEYSTANTTKVKFSGKVLQVIEGLFSHKIRLAVDNDYNKVILVSYNNKQVDGRILEDDQITVYGYFTGIYSYKTVLGATMSVPSVDANIIK